MASTMFLFPLLLLSYLELVGATHFAYATIQWSCFSGCPYKDSLGNPGSNPVRNYTVFNTFGYRRSFPWGVSPVNVGTTVSPGTIYFYPMMTTTPPSASIYQHSVDLLVQTLFVQDDWFMGQYNMNFITPANYQQYHYRSYFSDCCRLSSIRDKNNDVSWTVTGIYNRYSTISPYAAGTPRVYVQQYQPLIYTIPFISYSGAPIIISLATKLDSTLNTQVPSDPPRTRNTTFAYDKTTGTCTWTPYVTGLYAIAFFIEEQCTTSNNDQACANWNLTATGNQGSGNGPTATTCCSRIPLDFIFEVDPSCAGQVNCVEPPYFTKPFPEKTTTAAQRVWYFYRGIEGSFQVCAVDDTPGQIVSIDFGLSPKSSTLTEIGQDGNPTCYLFKWAPGLTDLDSFLCGVATSTPGYQGTPLKSQGNYCIKLIILDASTLVVSGIVRDFHYYHPNFNRSWNDCAQCSAASNQNPIVKSWVASTLDANHKPVFSPGSPVPKSTWGSGLSLASNSTVAGFYDWWMTDPATTNPRNVQVPVSIILSSGANINQAIFTFLSSAFFPIDNQGFGNEGSFHNYFYTYELNLYITYLDKAAGGGVDQIMNVAAQDDLWIFIDNVLPSGWNQHGIKPSNATSGKPYDFNVYMSTLNGSDGNKLVSGETYRCDIFYANRFGTPYILIQLPNNTLCTQLTSGQYAFNWTSFQGVALVDPTTTAIPANGLFYYAYTSSAPPSIGTVTRPSGASATGLKLFNQNSQGASVCYGTPLKALHGFIATFTFFVNNPNKKLVDGFAFVLNSYPYYRGNAAEQLGYGGLQKTFAVEIDMLQSSIVSDPDFTSCCGNFPYWDTAASGWGSTLPWGQIAYHAKPNPVGGSYQGNDASEASGGGLIDSGSSSGKIALDFKNGSEYTIKVVYQPAQDDGTTNAQPGWFWTYANAQLEPVVQTQVDGVLLRAMLGGATTVCFTSGGQWNPNTNSNPSGYGADIWLLSYSMLVVPTDAGSTAIISAQILGQPIVTGATNPISPVIAGQTSMVTVRARDACGNPITVGGELDLFSCNVTKVTCPGAPITCTGVDNGDGTYTFSFSPTIASPNYLLYIAFGPAGKQLAIKSSPFPFAVIAAPASINTSVAVFGQLPELLYNGGNDPFNGILRQQGVFAARFSQYGRVVAYQMFDFLNALDSYNGGTTSGATNLGTFINARQSTEYLLIAISGSDISATQISNAAAVVGSVNGAKFATVKSGNAYVLITRPGNQPTCLPSCELLTTTGTAKITARGTDNSSISFTRYFTLTASSANSDCGPWAVLNSVFDDIRVPAGTNNQFAIQARDIYTNLNALTVIAASFSPDLVPSTGGTLTWSNLFPTNGYFVYPFYSTKAGVFYLYTGLDTAGQNIRYGNGSAPFSAYPVTIDPGFANITNSYCQGAVLTTATAGTMATIQLVLFDRWSNQITFMNPGDNISATLIFRKNYTVVTTLNTSWVDGSCGTKCVLMASFYPTIAAIQNNDNVQFDVNVTINGYWKICGSPDIVPGPLSPANTTFDFSALGYSPAGSQTAFTITTRDRFGNQRRTPTSTGDMLSATFSPGVTGYSITYAGNGLYTVALTPTTKGNDNVTVIVTSSGSGDVKPAGNYTVGSQILKVVPGPASANSSLGGITPGQVVIAGTLNSFNVTSVDMYMNLRNNQPYNYAVASASDYYYRLNAPAIGVDASINLMSGSTYATTGIFTYQYNATLIGSYSLTLSTTPVVAQPTVYTVNNTPVPITVVPNCTYPQNTVFNGAGLGGGISGNTTSFNMTARDYFTNVQADWHDATLYNVTVKTASSSTNGTIYNSATAGNFYVTYVVPTNTNQAPLPYNITVCHTGTNSSSPPIRQCFNSWCTVFSASSINANRIFNGQIAVYNGAAGTQMNWTISDVNSTGGWSTGSNIVTSWTVTVTRTSPNDGASAAQSISVSCNKDQSGNCITSPTVYTNVTFTPTTNIGTFAVRVFAYGVETEQSKAGISVIIGPGPVYPPNCQVTGLPATVGAGVGGSFMVALKDQWFHNITNSSLSVRSSLTTPDPIKANTSNITASWVAGSQQFNFNYVLNTTGVWPVTIWETTSAAIGNIGSALQVTVNPGPASCLTSYVKNTVLNTSSPNNVFATAGLASTFTVVPLDKFGNPVTDTTTQVVLADVGGNATFTQTVVSAATPPAIEIQVTYLPYKVVLPNNVITVMVGNPICQLVGNKSVLGDPTAQQSPLNVIVNPGDIYPPLSTVSGTALGANVVANTSLTLTLTLEDKYGNPWFSNRASAIVGFVTPSTGQTYPAVTTATGQPGQYNLVLPASADQVASAWNGTGYAADYSWLVQANGATISGVGPNFLNIANSTVSAGPTAPWNTIPPTLVDVVSDVPQTYQVILQDAFGNRKYTGADLDTVQFTWIEGAIYCSLGEEIPPANSTALQTVSGPTYIGNGVYNVTIKGTAVGTWTLNLTVTPHNGVLGYYGQPNCAPLSRLVQNVLPGAAYPPMSYWTINQKTFNAGDSADIFVQVNDKEGNNILRSGTFLSWGSTLAPNSATPASPIPPVGPETASQLGNGWSISPRSSNSTPWIDPSFTASAPSFPISPSSPSPALATQTDFGNSSYRYSITFYKSGTNLPLVLGMLNASNVWVAVPWPSNLANNAAVTVNPGPPRQFSPTTAAVAQMLQNQGATAAIPTSFTVTAYDNYGNPVAQGTNASFDVTMKQQSNGYIVPITATQIGNGQTQFNLLSAWSGDFDLIITLHPGDGTADITPAPASVNIDGATCASSNPALPYRCPDRSCVATYAACAQAGVNGSAPSISTGDCGLMSPPKVTCSTGGPCVTDASLCPCPAGQTRCIASGGNCAAACAPVSTVCSSGYTICQTLAGTPNGQCRANPADCPSPAVCPPGYVICPSGVNCGRNASDCPSTAAVSCPQNTFQCPSGVCASIATDCPTPVTCPAATPVLCLTDGSCQIDAAHCPDQYSCYAPNTYRCPGTGICTTGLAQCPASVTCKTGYVLCASGSCATSVSACPAPEPCPLSQVKCPDGSCENNMLFCPSVTSCDPTVPIRCWDGSCVAFSVECSTPQACTTNVTCPGGACATSFSLCPTGTTCANNMPVLCPDGSCQATKDACTVIPDCPTDAPVRCPDGQSCRGSRTDCPTIVTCPGTGSVKCSDGTCALALDKCAPAVTCPSGLLRCPGGECIAGTTALCPTHETCNAGYGKCLDGTCRLQCPTSYQTCPSGQVTCPQAAAGVQCALNLTSCPQQPTCPPGLPVRCSDASCATTVVNCPTPPTEFPNNKIPCADGTWATTIASCPTPLTCPTATPAKCTDNSCRVTPADCPVTKLCSDAYPYLCSTGACTANPWDPACTSTSGKVCPSSAPVACAPLGSGVCMANLSACDAAGTLPLNCSGSACTVCGKTQTYCRSGACVDDSTNCPTVSCDPSIPYECTDGSCSADLATCPVYPQTNGCPANLGFKCAYNGMCMTQADALDATKCPGITTCPSSNPLYSSYKLCPDGSCYDATASGASQAKNCPGANGCPTTGTTFRCYDGSCVQSYLDCNSTSSTTYAAMCQPATPYKCTDGYCAKTSTACPPQLVSFNCTAPYPIQCATGACVGSALQCPPLNPTCPSGTVRCSSDATCKTDASMCVAKSNCPYRCDNGICAMDQSFCTIDPFTGCPGGTQKCNATGQCVATGQSCVVLSQPNGCPSPTPYKCPNGACMVNATNCNVGPSGACPLSAPILCPDGTCGTTCSGSSNCPTATPVRCPDGTCKSDATTCTTYNGCSGTTPYRCADGSCAVQSATARASDSCKLAVICSSGLYLCMDGGCVASPSLCQPLYCPSGTTYCNFGCYQNCSTSAAAICPSKSPILCADGSCVGSLALCGTSATGGEENTDCTGSTSVACASGLCVASQNQCPTAAAATNGQTINAQTANANSGCGGASQIMCPDGQCVSSSRPFACKIIPACPFKTYRWWDGSCHNTSSNYNALKCSSTSNVRCEDGWCRDKKLPYDGCSNNQKAWYQCPDRNCAGDPGSCNSVATGNPSTFPRFDTSCQFGACRRLLASSPRPAPCIPDSTKQCNAMIKAGGAAQLIEATVDISKTQTLPIALNNDLVAVATLTIPSGALSLTNGAATTSVSIRAVSDSRVRYAVNEIVPSRRSQYGSYLDYPITVLSVAFECVMPAEVKPTFTLNFTYTAWIDLTPPTIDYKDVCLARLIELQGFSTWECLISDRNLRGNATTSTDNFYVHKDGAPSQEVTSVFESCAPSSAPGVISPYNGSVYAFIFSPLPDVPTSPAGLDVVQRNIVWIILGILLGFALLILLAYCAFRLFRYREKYHTEREEADRLQEEVENMKQFGGDSGNKDDQVAMTANPLAVQLKDVQARYNEEELKLQAAESQLRKQEGEIRANHIDNMRDNRNKLAQELEKLKAQLAEAQAAGQPKATFEEHDGPTYSGDEPVREEFDSGSTSAAPKRGKKDL